jgi:DNA polymerase I-like protein with 3'-5' exonuclease and polymerase domains
LIDWLPCFHYGKKKKMAEIQKEAEEACGFFVQLGSAKQVSIALFDKLKLKPVIFFHSKIEYL